MKKIIIYILILLFSVSSAQASLLFTGGDTDHVNFGSATNIDDFSTFTFWTWFYSTSYTSNRYVFNKGVNSKRLRFITSGGNGKFEMAVGRATTVCSRDTVAGSWSTNTWTFVALVYEESADTCKVYAGTLTSPVAELAYAAGQAGSGATTSDGANDFVIGNRATVNNNSFPGRIAAFGYINRALSATQIRSLQYQPRNVLNTKIFSILGFNGVGTQPDWSGNRNSGTVGGTVEGVAPNVPLRFFGM